MVIEVYKMQMPMLSNKHILLTKFNLNACSECLFFVHRMEHNGDA